MKSIHEVLDEFRAASVDERDKGDLFEALVLSYLQVDPIYAGYFDKVWLYFEWAKENGLPGNDVGIDLVARNRETGDITAIQCKFYAENAYLDKKEIDSFFTASGKEPFRERIIFSTTDNWSKNAEDAIHNQQIPVVRVRVQDLDESGVDWSDFSLKSPGALKRKPKKTPFPHQSEAIEDAIRHFASNDRGKLIMACGTGKTFTSLKIVESMLPKGGTVLFLVPSIALLSQTLREWKNEASVGFRAYAVCSDSKVGKRSSLEDIQVPDLAYPATTNTKKLASHFQKASNETLTVVFSTYQSIEVVAEAQKNGVPAFDLIVCDEAHRTTGKKLAGDDETSFQRVHDDDFISGRKRLYMTATPKIFNDAVKQKAEENDVLLASMDDPKLYGVEFHRLNFGQAVARGLLSDYKVLVLAVSEQHVSRQLQNLLTRDGEIDLDDATKIAGCYNGLRKRSGNDEDFSADPAPMRTAVAFAKSIKDSKRIAELFQVVASEINKQDGERDGLIVEAEHVDGTFNVLARNHKLDWLKDTKTKNTARILSNARCLSEGVDVPALDAVLFLNARESQVDVVQTVGRVMRKAENKRYGYVILPITVPAGVTPEEALADNKKYKVVWQVLQALRAHDERFDAMIHKIDLNGETDDKVKIIGVGGELDGEAALDSQKKFEQQLFEWDFPEWKDAILAKMVQKVGESTYWEKWAKDVADIAGRYSLRIETLLETQDEKITLEFNKFLKGVRGNLNPAVTPGEAIEMLSQHMITQPVFDALFEGYEFSELNPVSQVMQSMVETLESYNLDLERASLDSFYESVRLRASGVTSASAKQRIVKDLYETFFKIAFPKMAQRLGIVYTPIEVVDFMLHATQQILKDKFDKAFSDKNVHVLDPFTGTGTFIVRLLQLGLLDGKDILHKFRTELHANEIVLLAYYVAAINIEEAFHSITGAYEPFNGIVLTDTFQMTEDDDELDIGGVFRVNNERVSKQNSLPVQVIIGNPPYSIGQSNQNDNNQNLTYKYLDRRVEDTYAAKSIAGNRRGLYDSYVKAFRWATDRLDKSRGLVAFVSNGSWLDTRSADGMRKSLLEEFSEIWVYNLKGNIRKFDKAEGGNIFGSGSMTPITITFLLKDDTRAGQAVIHYAEIPDALSTQEKLEEISSHSNLSSLVWQEIEPNTSGDWLNLRTEEFAGFTPIGSKAKGENGRRIFDSYFTGVVTSRDAWSYNFSKQELQKNMKKLVNTYNEHVDRYGEGSVETPLDNDETKISWSRALKKAVTQRKVADFDSKHIRLASYRPYQKSWLYTDRLFVEAPSLNAQFFPEGKENIVIVVPSPADRHNPGVYITNSVVDFNLAGIGVQCFPLYSFPDPQTNSLFETLPNTPFAISTEACEDFSAHYGMKIDGEMLFYYCYGVLSSNEYQNKFRADLKKQLPHIPKARSFGAFESAGRALAKLNLGYEELPQHPLDWEMKTGFDFRVEKMSLSNDSAGSTLSLNSKVKAHGIPKEAFDYLVFGRAPIEWVVARFQKKVDKGSGLVSDPNLWAEEQGDPEYIKKLVGRSITLSIQASNIIASMPPLDIQTNPA